MSLAADADVSKPIAQTSNVSPVEDLAFAACSCRPLADLTCLSCVCLSRSTSWPAGSVLV